MVSCHLKEALNYKFKHKRANVSLNSVNPVAKWLHQVRPIWVPIATKVDSGVATHLGPKNFAQ